MTRARRRSSALAAVTVFAVGVAVAAAAWAGGSSLVTAGALVAFYALAAAGIVVWSRRSDADLPALLGGGGDERQRSLDLRATACAGLAMGLFSLGLALVALARQDDNPWLLICLVGAVAYAASLTYLRRSG